MDPTLPPAVLAAHMAFPIAVHLRDAATGRTRVHETDGTADAEGAFDDFIWSEGNYACDCNRALFLFDWGPEAENRACGRGGIVIDKIVRLDTGETAYTESDE